MRPARPGAGPGRRRGRAARAIVLATVVLAGIAGSVTPGAPAAATVGAAGATAADPTPSPVTPTSPTPTAGASGSTPASPAPTTPTTPGAPEAPEYWLAQWQVPQLWRAGATGHGITIAEIDTGVDAAVGVFAGRVGSGIDFGSLGGDGRIDRDTDPYGHGTSMASIMVGRPGQFGIRGLAPDATLLPVAVPLAGTTDAAAADHLPQAIRWAADHGADIISMSLGGVRRRGQQLNSCPTREQQAIFHALRRGAVVFAASGNRGPRDNAVEEPGVCLGVVSVGAVDSTGHVADFSSRHPYLTMTAPGVDVASIGPGGAPFSGDGTSQATAIASAAAADVWSRHPGLTGRQLVARLLATLDGRRRTPDPAYGYGRLDLARAVTAQVPTDAPNPVYALADSFLAGAGGPAAVRPPRPASLPAHPAGRVRIAAVSAPAAPSRAPGLVVAALGLLALVGLAVGALLRRGRTRDRAGVPQPRGPAVAGATGIGEGRADVSDSDERDAAPAVRRPRPYR